MMRITKITKKIFIEIEMTIKSLREIVKVIIPIITLPLSLFPQQF
jgi:hypothetical protein